MDTNTLRNGDLLTWVESLPWDDRATYSVPEYEGLKAVHVRVGLLDVVVHPAARNKVTGEVLWSLTAHTHPAGDEDSARECFAENKRRNERTEFEATIDEERAQARNLARSMGIPEKMIEKMVPLTGPDPLEGVIDQVKAQMSRGVPMDQAVSQAASEAARRLDRQDSDGPTGVYL